MKNYSINEVLPVLNLNDYQNRDLTATIKLSDQINQFYPCEVVLIFSEYDNAEHYENADIKMIYKNTPFYIRYWEHKKKYIIYTENLTKQFKNVDSYAINKIKSQLDEPQQIGVLSVKKIINWFEYYIAIIEEATKLNDINGNKKEIFLKSIEGQKVQWFNGGKSGEIIKNGVKFSFTIGETSINTKIEVYYQVPSSIEAFLKLADNKY